LGKSDAIKINLFAGEIMKESVKGHSPQRGERNSQHQRRREERLVPPKERSYSLQVEIVNNIASRGERPQVYLLGGHPHQENRAGRARTGLRLDRDQNSGAS